jgi:exopolyphosphatase/guanosine-5'-triphosphate,3'-diphosphate pyrophosphatase
VERSHQLVAGALVADAVMDIFGLTELEVCPWALREGVILERLDLINGR